MLHAGGRSDLKGVQNGRDMSHLGCRYDLTVSIQEDGTSE